MNHDSFSISAEHFLPPPTGTLMEEESDASQGSEVDVPMLGPVMQYLGDNQSHPVHLVRDLKHQAQPGKETLFCSAVLNYTREKRVRKIDSTKWGEKMRASADAAQALLESSFFGSLVRCVCERRGAAC
jgi:hypothetical protein